MYYKTDIRISFARVLIEVNVTNPLPIEILVKILVRRKRRRLKRVTQELRYKSVITKRYPLVQPSTNPQTILLEIGITLQDKKVSLVVVRPVNQVLSSPVIRAIGKQLNSTGNEARIYTPPTLNDRISSIECGEAKQ
ncbi:hypothetical protein HAX54_049563 [Datura stramonium]|uniref:Uncharacterized protein n=1 Tax=Datura stramonium TaxID=4076 RepID=A0ABS8WKJ4_DATST|nr:hypothetical protein [Datura stramonium]